MPKLPFLNTNVLLRHLTQDSATLSPMATALVQRLTAGDLTVTTTDTVVFETVYTLQRFYRIPRPQIRAGLLPLLELRTIRLPGKRRYWRAFELYVTYPALSFADCYHVAFMESRGLTELISFDRGFDRVVTIVRREPDGRGALRQLSSHRSDTTHLQRTGGVSWARHRHGRRRNHGVHGSRGVPVVPGGILQRYWRRGADQSCPSNQSAPESQP